MNKILGFFRKKKRAMKTDPPGEDCTVEEPTPVNEYVSERQRAADQEVTEWYKTLRGLGPFIK
ncbi:MAG TPA: hypothetical protein VF268_02760 [Gammaproteobacteria bacterium]|jgi:hypothetical protein